METSKQHIPTIREMQRLWAEDSAKDSGVVGTDSVTGETRRLTVGENCDTTGRYTATFRPGH